MENVESDDGIMRSKDRASPGKRDLAMMMMMMMMMIIIIHMDNLFL